MILRSDVNALINLRHRILTEIHKDKEVVLYGQKKALPI